MGVLKYDDASWHYGGDFPKDLPDEAGATHIGMFVAWALLAGLSGDIHTEEYPEGVEKLGSRSITPGQFFLEACDGKFTDEDLNDEGNAFAHVQDTWTNFDKLRPVLDKRFDDWRRSRE